MDRSRYCFMLIVIMLVSLIPLGCGGKVNSTARDMLDVLPENADALFIYSRDAVSQVPIIEDMWDSLAEQTLPPGAEPLAMGVVSGDSNILGLMYTFEGELPAYTGNFTVEERDFRGVQVTRVDDFWDMFQLGNVTVFDVKDYSEEHIASYLDGGPSDDAAFAAVNAGSVPDAGFTIIMRGFTVAGLKAVTAITMEPETDREGWLAFRGTFTGDGGPLFSSVAMADFLERSSVKDANISKDEQLLEITGRIAAADFTDLMDMLTKNW